jgi:uncharacterized protein
MRKTFFLIIFLFLTLLAYAQDIPRPVGWVNDFAGVISPEYKNKLNSLIKELEQKTDAEIAVATIDSIAPYDEISYTRMLFDNWKPGKKGKDNGVLVLLAIKERRWRIEAGYGLEGILPDGVCGEIGRNYMVPLFKQAKYSEGLYYGVVAVAKIISQDARVKINNLTGIELKKQREGVPVFLYLLAPIFFFLWNLPWPFIIGLPFTLIFVAVFFGSSPPLGILVILSYIASLFARYHYWRKLPPNERHSFFGPQSYGGTYYGGDWGGGGFGGGGFGGFGGGGGGGGGAGGGF